MKHLDFFRKHPVFTTEELSRHLAFHGATGPRTKEALLEYHRKAGRLMRIRRGLYAIVPEGADPYSYNADPFLIAGKLTSDAVLSYHTALEFHGKAHTVHEVFTYSSSHPLKQFHFRPHVFRGTRFPKPLMRSGNEHAHVDVSERSGINLRVTSLERTLVDVLDRPGLCGSWEEIWRSLASVEYFDLEKVVDYAVMLQNSTTAAKVGFFLDQHREQLMVEDKHLTALIKMRPRQPHYLERTRREPGRLISKWNLVIPDQILEQTWEEII